MNAGPGVDGVDTSIGVDGVLVCTSIGVDASIWGGWSGSGAAGGIVVETGVKGELGDAG